MPLSITSRPQNVDCVTVAVSIEYKFNYRYMSTNVVNYVVFPLWVEIE